ncbi:protein priA [Lentinula raphanica]|uniref:Protein priA n=1 Tax=Lentinula raphanica TaxID=153919 RepID=A0AA38P1P6_9AGAR|nr:hypothetical protein C8R42DRAFT_777055 [Lentinula raphanica]KAJ3761883.1 protein priA [Lentinula raphanica]KAJ3774921.1 protein priA [Lentinula raphanica]KAJ3819230.1 protein priA [Lentinula raphanica]KAJ3834531.1 protein priA [Lentinula raphanica]
MAFVKRVVAFSLLALAVAPFVSASTLATRTTKSASKSCSKGEFYFERKDCCLSTTTPTHTPTPPSGKSCPTQWYWHTDYGCCVPSKPVPTPSGPSGSTPPPQCGKNSQWEEALLCCTPTPSKPTPTPKPSSTPKQGNGNGHHYKRAPVSRDVPACPKGLDACPISGLLGDFECLDTSVELESCGGCASTGQGQDCTAIEGAWNVGCNSGSCKVYSCFAGYKLSSDGTSCIAL